MKASISFPELQTILQEKVKHNISIAFVDKKTVKVTYPFNWHFIKKDISANLIIKELIGSDLLLQLAAGFGSDTMLTTILSFFQDKLPEGLLEKLPDSHILLHLSQIEQVKTVFDTVDITDIHVFYEGLEVEGHLK